MNNLLQEYFKNLEEYLVKSASLSGVSSTDPLERGTAAEDFVASVIASHLPKRAAVVTHRQIIGADSVRLGSRKRYGPEGQGPSKPVDLIVYNEWTTVPNLLSQGYILAESVYLAIEVKARDNSSMLKRAISDAVKKQLPYAKVIKRLRPETTYLGNVRRPKDLPLFAARTGRPTYGIFGILWGKGGNLSAKECLESVQESIAETRRQMPWRWPDVIYVPQQFLAFKVITEAEFQDDKGKKEVSPVSVYKNEYPFLSKKWPTAPLTLKALAEATQRSSRVTKMEYRYIEGRDSTPNLLYAFIFWLCQEVLKFLLEVPDYHRYMMNKDSSILHGREGAAMSSHGTWSTATFDGKKDQWCLQPKKGT